MFKTTPRSVLLGGDLLRKSAMRVYIDDEGNLQHFDDTILDEHFGAYEHTDGSRIDRAPFGRQEDGNSHMIDAMLEHMLRLAAKNGFAADQVIGKKEDGTELTITDAAKKTIDAMIWNENESRPNDPANQLPHFDHPSRRKLVLGKWFGEGKGKDKLIHAAEGAGSSKVYNIHTGQWEDTPSMITATLKSGVPRHDYSDKGQYIDAGYQPFHKQVEPGMQWGNERVKEMMGLGPNEVGPFHDPNGVHMFDFTQPGVKPSAMTRGRVHGIQTKDFNAMLQTDRLGPEDADRVELYSGTPYQTTELNAPVHTASHGGVHYPAIFHAPQPKTGSGTLGERKFNRGNKIRQLLQQVAAAGGKDAAKAQEFLNLDAAPPPKGSEKGHVPLLTMVSTTPAMTHFFGGKGEGGSSARASSLGQNGFGFKSKGMRRVPTTLQTIADNLSVGQQHVNQAHPAINVELPKHLPTGKRTTKVIHNLHALFQGLINRKASEGSQDPMAEAAEEIRMHGMDKLTPEQQGVADVSRQVKEMYERHHGLVNPIQGAMQAPLYDTSRFAGVQTPESGALRAFERQGEVPPEDTVATSFDNYIPDINQIQKSFETLQVMSAMKDDSVMKYVKKGYSINSHNDIRSFGMAVGITTSDIQGIMATKGDWDVVAKQWNVSPTIVKATKVTFGGV